MEDGRLARAGPQLNMYHRRETLTSVSAFSLVASHPSAKNAEGWGTFPLFVI
jgi:hypothetical protein